VAGLLITTEAMVAEELPGEGTPGIPKPRKQSMAY
jgi:hypothetical protein